MPISTPFNPVSPQAGAISGLFIGLLIAAAVVLALVTGLVTISILRFRARPGQGEPRQIFGVRWIEVTWTVIPLLTIAVIFIFTARTAHTADPPTPDRAPDLRITGHQWWWEARYPAAHVVTANEIHLPVGRRMLVQMDSADVIHCWWVPRLGRKEDLTPGHPTYLWMQADKPGTYNGACAEYCGGPHAWMLIRVIVEPPAAFDAWERAQAAHAGPPASPLAAQGAKLFTQRTCANCHAIGGTRAIARVGPDLTHIGSRQTLAAGALNNTPRNMSEWLANPQDYKPGCNMPNLQLSPEQVKALSAYLEGLK